MINYAYYFKPAYIYIYIHIYDYIYNCFQITVIVICSFSSCTGMDPLSLCRSLVDIVLQHFPQNGYIMTHQPGDKKKQNTKIKRSCQLNFSHTLNKR